MSSMIIAMKKATLHRSTNRLATISTINNMHCYYNGSFKRYQSSSSSTPTPLKAATNSKKISAAELQQQQQIQKDLQKTNEQTNDINDTTTTNNNNNNNNNLKTTNDEAIPKKAYKPKQGFSSLPKVPSTMTLKPKDILLDKLFSGYRPITLPIEKKKKNGLNGLRSLGKRNAVVYVEFDDALDLGDEFEDGLQEGNEFYEEQLKLEDKNLTRFRYSNYSFHNSRRGKYEDEEDGEDGYSEEEINDSISLLKNSLNTLAESANINNNNRASKKAASAAAASSSSASSSSAFSGSKVASGEGDKRIAERNGGNGRRRVKILKKTK